MVVDLLVKRFAMDRDTVFAVSQLLAASVAVEIAYRQIEKIPTSGVLSVKLELAKKTRELRDIQSTLIQEAYILDKS